MLWVFLNIDTYWALASSTMLHSCFIYVLLTWSQQFVTVGLEVLTRVRRVWTYTCKHVNNELAVDAHLTHKRHFMQCFAVFAVFDRQICHCRGSATH